MKSCAHCGGEVGEDGFALKMHDGGEAPSGEHEMPLGGGKEREEIETDESRETEQQESTEALRAGAFSDALSARAHGDVKIEESKTASTSAEDSDADLIRRMKAARYSRRG